LILKVFQYRNRNPNRNRNRVFNIALIPKTFLTDDFDCDFDTDFDDNLGHQTKQARQ